MGDTHYGNAMTEVALALAMGFFSIMVLAMVSMGAGSAVTDTAGETEAARSIAARLAPAKASADDRATVAPAADDMLLIYFRGTFFDRALTPVDPAGMTFAGRVLLALPPDLAMSEALAVRERVATENLVVSMLNPEWLGALQRAGGKEQ